MQRYIETAREKVRKLSEDGEALILGIESSCDETAAAVLRGDKVLSNVIDSQLDIHKKFGGVVPEIASRKHLEVINVVIEQALQDAGVTLEDIQAIGVTCGPGLVGALLIGVSAAKAIAYARGIPLIGVNHVEGHMNAALLAYPELKPPYLSLIASGGHTQFVLIRDYCTYELLGGTKDDAAGEAFDKVGRTLGLPYPGGPEIEALARGINGTIRLPSPLLEKDLQFSFSGIKTAVVNAVNSARMAGKEIDTADYAASFQTAVVRALAEGVGRAIDTTHVTQVALAGGVAANKALQVEVHAMCEKKGVKFYAPPSVMCTDNAAMIGYTAYLQIMRGQISDLSLNAQPAMKIGSVSFV